MQRRKVNRRQSCELTLYSDKDFVRSPLCVVSPAVMLFAALRDIDTTFRCHSCSPQPTLHARVNSPAPFLLAVSGRGVGSVVVPPALAWVMRVFCFLIVRSESFVDFSCVHAQRCGTLGGTRAH